MTLESATDVAAMSPAILHAVPSATSDTTLPDVDRPRAIAAATDLLAALGRDIDSEHLRETPRRVVDALLELLTPEEFSATTFPNSDGYDQLVMVTDVPFQSLCEHHLLPFRGVARIGYLPGDRLLGLSKFARVLDYFSRDLQVQERLTRQVAEWLDRELQPRGVGVVLEAEHLCMTLRGAQATGSRTVTSAFLGELAHSGAHRAQFGSETGR
ncbi:GTP cyclohydrolase I [Salinibacterium sp. ZJ454]|uniref:GTP cyclohydrolase I n=1 Tax=Salinibacterium sp. ZJ454 TaxID=2708339 RepID=UPI001FBA84C1|nr:GTP cyclohydrolase I [Salinibacterium sp. ZJ454]